MKRDFNGNCGNQSGSATELARQPLQYWRKPRGKHEGQSCAACEPIALFPGENTMQQELKNDNYNIHVHVFAGEPAALSPALSLRRETGEGKLS